MSATTEVRGGSGPGVPGTRPTGTPEASTGLDPISPDAAAADFVPSWRRGVNVAHFLTQTARRLPEHPAIIAEEGTWTWRDLDERAHAITAALRGAGVRRRDTVMVLSPNHPEMIAAFWGAFRAGGVLAPPNAKLSPGEIAALVRNTRPRVLVVHRELSAVVRHLAEEGLLPATVLWIDGVPEAHEGTAVADLPVPEESARFEAEVDEDDPCWYFFTSGSTGTPKAATFTHRHLGAVLMNHYCDLFPGEDHTGASLVIAPLSHGAGIHMFAQVFAGCPSVLYPSGGFRGEKAWPLIDAHGVTNAFTVPTILNRLVEGYPADRGPSDHTLRNVVYAGAPMLAQDQEHALERLGECLVQYFGLAEVTGAITALRPSEHGTVPVDDAGIGTCGRARTGVRISIRETGDDGIERDLPPGVSGEVCVAGPTVCAGYLNNAKANAESFAHGWFHTGDVGYLDEQGYLFLTGRKSDMFISGGSNVYPREIEEALLLDEAVAAVAVLGVPDPKWGEAGVAIVELRDPSVLDGVTAGDGTAAREGAMGDPENPLAPESIDVGVVLPEESERLRAFVASRLAGYKVPRETRFVRSMPVTAYGKIARKELKAGLLARAASNGAGS